MTIDAGAHNPLTGATLPQVGEFVEVSNNSDTDPCAWVGVVDKLGKSIKVRRMLDSGLYIIGRLCLHCMALPNNMP